MSDLAWRLRQQQQAIGQTIVGDIPGIRLPFIPSALLPIPLASSGIGCGYYPQSRAVVLLAWLVSVYVVAPNNGGAYWTITLQNDAGITIASVNTSAASAATGTRLAATSITQPSAGNTYFQVVPIATGAPGAIYLMPEVVVG